MIKLKRPAVFAGIAFLFLFMAAVPVSAQTGKTGEEEPGDDGFDMTAFARCEICSSAFQEMDLIMACDVSVADMSDGVLFRVLLNKPELMDRFRALQEKDEKLCAKFKSLPLSEYKKRLCPMCAEYCGLLKRGMHEERIKLPEGVVTITRTNDPALLEEVRAWADKVRKNMASFDEQAFMADGAEPSAEPVIPEKPAVPKSVEVPVGVLEFMKRCELCKLFAEQPDMMLAARLSVIDLKNGMALLHTVHDPGRIKAFQEFSEGFMAKAEEFRSRPPEETKKKLCSICRRFGDLVIAGAVMDYSDTPVGTITIMTSSDPDLVNKIHALAQQFKFIEQMDSMMK